MRCLGFHGTKKMMNPIDFLKSKLMFPPLEGSQVKVQRPGAVWTDPGNRYLVPQ
ncbi:MAG: hypothetical protein Ct9H90mP16_13140 [Candidatus Poseidoniales archaeon]|nr:MAG: hypothetical protein Ct9H90mP16_13140 [Candidatus Poseidoniales archaeon]